MVTVTDTSSRLHILHKQLNTYFFNYNIYIYIIQKHDKTIFIELCLCLCGGRQGDTSNPGQTFLVSSAALQPWYFSCWMSWALELRVKHPWHCLVPRAPSHEDHGGLWRTMEVRRSTWAISCFFQYFKRSGRLSHSHWLPVTPM